MLHLDRAPPAQCWLGSNCWLQDWLSRGKQNQFTFALQSQLFPLLFKNTILIISCRVSMLTCKMADVLNSSRPPGQLWQAQPPQTESMAYTVQLQQQALVVAVVACTVQYQIASSKRIEQSPLLHGYNRY